MKPVLQSVEVVKEADGYFRVKPFWANVDRPYVGGYSVGKNDKLGQRLKTAIMSGKIWYKEPELLTDCNGKTYVNANLNIHMRSANADLQKFGF